MSTPIFWVGPWKIFHKNRPSCRLQGDVQPVTQSKVEVTAETKAGVEEATRRRRHDMSEVGAEYEYIYIYIHMHMDWHPNEIAIGKSIPFCNYWEVGLYY